MTTARYCLLSLLLVILAIGVHAGALRDWSRNAGTLECLYGFSVGKNDALKRVVKP